MTWVCKSLLSALFCATDLRQRVRVQPATPRMPLIRSSTPARPSFNPSHTPRRAMGTPAFRPASGPQFMMQAGYSKKPIVPFLCLH